MKSKRSIFLCLAVVLSMTMVLSSTMAYLQDSDDDVNVMTLGSVFIEQIEQQRKPDGTLEDFKDDKALLPGVYLGGDDRNPPKDGAFYNAGQVNYAVDKIVSVKNTGRSPAYVRTLFAFEQGYMSAADFNELMIINWDSDAHPQLIANDVSINGMTYTVYEVVYPNALQPGETSDTSLLQVLLSRKAGNEDVFALDADGDEKYRVKVVSQAVQYGEAFGSAQAALDLAFGDVTAEDPWVNDWWVTSGTDITTETDVITPPGHTISPVVTPAPTPAPTHVVTAAETALREAVAVKANEKRVVLTENVDLGDKPLEIKIGHVILDLNGYTLTGNVDGALVQVGYDATLVASLTINDSKGEGAIVNAHEDPQYPSVPYFDKSYGIAAKNSSNVTINGGRIQGYEGGACITGTTVINGGVIIGDIYGIRGETIIVNKGTIYGGEIGLSGYDVTIRDGDIYSTGNDRRPAENVCAGVWGHYITMTGGNVWGKYGIYSTLDVKLVGGKVWGEVAISSLSATLSGGEIASTDTSNTKPVVGYGSIEIKENVKILGGNRFISSSHLVLSTLVHDSYKVEHTNRVEDGDKRQHEIPDGWAFFDSYGDQVEIGDLRVGGIYTLKPIVDSGDFCHHVSGYEARFYGTGIHVFYCKDCGISGHVENCYDAGAGLCICGHAVY